MEKEIKAPAGKFVVVKWVEDLDTVDPCPDSPVEIGVRDTLEEARVLAIERDSVWAHTCVYDDTGKHYPRKEGMSSLNF